MFNKIRSAWGFLNSPIGMLMKPLPTNDFSEPDGRGEDGFEERPGNRPRQKNHAEMMEDIDRRAFPRKPTDFLHVEDAKDIPVAVMDFIEGSGVKFSVSGSAISPVMLDWYTRQGFIGYQSCAIIAQNWIVNRACSLPGKDAIRNGYDITSNSGDALKPEVIQDIRDLDQEFRINHHMKELSKMRRVFGIRIALFVVESKDKKYYEKPFNIDGVTEGSYKGIVQVDPYWITPELDSDAAANPASMYFYDPTYWRINGRLYHRTHLIISRYADVADVLKPNYIYGGIPLVQMIYERAYSAERSANEAPQLLLTKRLNIIRTDTKSALANLGKFMDRINVFSQFKNNQGLFVIDKQEEFDQKDTALSNVDKVIEGQYDIVAAISEVPVTKLMGRQITGLNSEGTGDRRNYEDVLESEQEILDPLLDRHHLLLMKSHIEPKRGTQPRISHTWNPVTSATAKELADIRKLDMETAEKAIASGIITSSEVRDKILADKNSGYSISETDTSEDVDYSDYNSDETDKESKDRLFPNSPVNNVPINTMR